MPPGSPWAEPYWGAALSGWPIANLPYRQFITAPDGSDYLKLKGIWLFILAIAVHNFPEGLAVGVGFGGGNIGNGLALAIGIGLQNMPEGLAVAFALLTQNYSKWTAFWIALATGLVEPIGGLFGVGIITLGGSAAALGVSFCCRGHAVCHRR